MDPKVHARALRAAARVAFSVAFAGGCAANVDIDESGSAGAPAPTDAEAPAAPERGDGITRPVTEPRAPSSGRGDRSKGPNASCDALVNAAFPTDGGYPGVKADVSLAVETCCLTLLDDTTKPLEAHRWDCCANLPPDVSQIPIGCTPWGPPTPPRMRSRRVALPSLNEVA